jgi:adenylate kinase family enzyme
MQKIIIVGCPGSGKTTLANQLGKILDIPVHHLDKIFWKEGKKASHQDEFRKLVKELMKEDKWILDGNFKRSVEDRIEKADTVILFDFPKLIIIWRVFKRFFKHFNKVRPDMGGNNKERIEWLHFKYILTYPMKEYLLKISLLSKDKNLFILKNPREVRVFLKNISTTT